MCLDRIEDDTRDGRNSFFADARTQDAVVRNREVIGPAVRDFDLTRLNRADPLVPWAQSAGMRNVRAHQYLGVDLQLDWKIASNELPKLRAAVAALLVGGPRLPAE